MKERSTLTSTYKDLVAEARLEVIASQQNLKDAIAKWATAMARMHPAFLELEASERRLERANALLRSALEAINHTQT